MNVQAIVKRMFHTKPSKIVGVDIGTGSIKNGADRNRQ